MVEEGVGLASFSSTSSLTVVALFPLVDMVKPACLKELKSSNKLANSSPIFLHRI